MTRRLWYAAVVAFWLGAVLAAFGQEAPKPEPTPVLTIEETVMVEAVMALQKQAQVACDTLKETGAYREMVTKANRALQAKGKRIDWATGKVSAVAPKGP